MEKSDMSLPGEVWKDIKGYEGAYQVSNKGRIKSLPRTTTNGGVMKLYVNTWNGYCYVGLHFKGNYKSYRVHRLVMNAFVGEMPDKQINHINGIKTDNSLENLEYCTASENLLHAHAHGLVNKTWSKKVINLDTGTVFDSAFEAALSVGGHKANSVIRACKGARSHYRNAHFAYYDDYLTGNIPAFKGIRKKKSSECLWKR